jgi:hypothetical protein
MKSNTLIITIVILLGLESFAQKNSEPFIIEKHISSIGGDVFVIYRDKNSTDFNNKPVGENGNTVDLNTPLMFLKSDKPVNKQFGFSEKKIIEKLNRLALSVCSQKEAEYHSRNTRAMCISSSADGEIVSVSFLVGENNSGLDAKKLEKIAKQIKENFIIEIEPKNEIVQHGYFESSFPVCRIPKKKPDATEK